MKRHYVVLGKVEVPGVPLVNVHFGYGIDKQGTVTVPQSVANSEALDSVIQWKLGSLAETVEQLAALEE